MALDAPEAGPATRPPRAAVADETLLDALAALTPEERLRWNDRMATTVLELRNGFAEGQRVRVVRLETLADLKRNASSAKDRLVLAILEDTLRSRGAR